MNTSSKTKPTKFATVMRSSYRDASMAIHAAGCSDLHRERTDHGGVVTIVEGTVEEALENLLDAELVEMGYTAHDVKVYPCCSKGPKAEKPVDPTVCPGSGKPFKKDPYSSAGRALYAPCSACGKYVGTGKGTAPRHKAPVKKAAPAPKAKKARECAACIGSGRSGDAGRIDEAGEFHDGSSSCDFCQYCLGAGMEVR